MVSCHSIAAVLSARSTTWSHRVLIMELLGRGRTAEVYEWGASSVIKLYFDWCPREWIDREVTVTRLLTERNMPIPKYIDEICLQGRRGLILERISGSSLVRKMMSKPWTIVRFARRFAELHSRIHQLQGMELPDLRQSVKRAIESDNDIPDDIRKGAIGVLEELPDQDALCHYDFHADQVMVTKSGLVVLDWMTACRGSPAADVARTSVISIFARSPEQSFWKNVMVHLAGNSFYSTYRRQYVRSNPKITEQQIDKWMIPIAAARLNENIAGEAERILPYLSDRIHCA
jgi:thiamine kinase-like enzyme